MDHSRFGDGDCFGFGVHVRNILQDVHKFEYLTVQAHDTNRIPYYCPTLSSILAAHLTVS
jgi:hypothetical protein